MRTCPRPIIFDEAPTIPGNAALDEYESVEGLSGSRFNDILTGVEYAGRRACADDRRRHRRRRLHRQRLSKEGIAAHLRPGGGAGNALRRSTRGGSAIVYSAGDIILGGDGSDTIMGLAGDDIIDGDKWLERAHRCLRHRRRKRARQSRSYKAMTELLAAACSTAPINPGQSKIVREINRTRRLATSTLPSSKARGANMRSRPRRMGKSSSRTPSKTSSMARIVSATSKRFSSSPATRSTSSSAHPAMMF